jgi:hypothetical protein
VQGLVTASTTSDVPSFENKKVENIFFSLFSTIFPPKYSRQKERDDATSSSAALWQSEHRPQD